MKKTLAVVGAVALAGVLAVTAAGCAKSTKNLASLSSNWYYDTGFKRIQPTFTEENAEKLTYLVTQSKPSTNVYYSVLHEQGTYTTEFYAKKITATELAEITFEDWREDYTKALGKEGYMYLYYYKTELSIPKVTFTCGGNTKEFTDQSVQTESYFLSVEDYLRPVYTIRTINRTIPKELQVSSLEGSYFEVDMVYESFYTISGNRVKTLITDNNATGDKLSAFEVSGMASYPNSVFDVAYLDLVARGMRNVGSSFSQNIAIYSPGLQLRDYTISGGSKALFDNKEQSDLQLAIFEGILKDKGLFTPQPVDEKDPSKGETKLKTASVSIAYNGGNYSGVSQTYWFAVGKETRTLMLKYSEPLHYNLGQLDYVLTSINNIGE